MTITTERFIEIMEAAKAAIMERGWCQRVLEDDQGHVCAIGALNVAVSGQSRHPQGNYFGVIRPVARVLGGRVTTSASYCAEDDLVRWNNSAGRTEAEVLELFDDTIIWIKEHPEALAR